MKHKLVEKLIKSTDLLEEKKLILRDLKKQFRLQNENLEILRKKIEKLELEIERLKC